MESVTSIIPLVCTLVGIAGVLFSIIIAGIVKGAPAGDEKMQKIAGAIKEGAIAYLNRQLKSMSIAGIIIFVIWVVLGWLLSLIHFIGFIFAIALFSLVITAYITLFVCWIMGMKYALTNTLHPLPIVGELIQRFQAFSRKHGVEISTD